MWLLHGFMVLLAATGTALLAVALRNLARGSASRDWSCAQGRILRSFVLVDKNDDGGNSYTPKVEYEYSVAGSSFRGSRLRYGQTGTWNRGQAERILAPFPENAPVPVYVDPRNPKQAVLLPGTSWGNVAIAAAGLIFLGCACLFWKHAR